MIYDIRNIKKRIILFDDKPNFVDFCLHFDFNLAELTILYTHLDEQTKNTLNRVNERTLQDYSLLIIE